MCCRLLYLISKLIVYCIHRYENIIMLLLFVCWNNKYLFIYYLFIYHDPKHSKELQIRFKIIQNRIRCASRFWYLEWEENLSRNKHVQSMLWIQIPVHWIWIRIQNFCPIWIWSRIMFSFEKKKIKKIILEIKKHFLNYRYL